TRTVEIRLRVRRHTDGRAIVYAGYIYESLWQGEEQLRVRVGDLIGPGDDLVRAIQRVGGELADRIEDEPGAQRLRDVIDARIADLPAEELWPVLSDALDLPPDTVRRVVTAEVLARIDSYAGGARDLHELLAAVLPLDRPRWYE